MIGSFKIRIYPTREQEQKLWQHIGACRFIWNWMLEYQTLVYNAGGDYVSGYNMLKLLKHVRNCDEFSWTKRVSSKSMQAVCLDLDKAYKDFFKKTRGFPKFKSRKKSRASYPSRSESLYFNNGVVNIEKVGKVKYKTDFDIPQGRGHKFSNPRISHVNGKWMLSFGMECESQAPVLTDKSVGIDLGVKEQCVVVYGDEQLVFHNINKSKRVRELKKKIRHTQRSISRKYEANRQGKAYIKTKNIEREEFKLRKLYARIANIRHNYIHQTTHKIISLLPYRVVMEDLNVSGMMKNEHLSKAIAEQNFYEFIRQMQYKCEWNGIEFIQVDRFFPSSKTCSCCGNIKHDLKLSDRIFKCECGFEADRDFNAALNLSRYAV